MDQTAGSEGLMYKISMKTNKKGTKIHKIREGREMPEMC